MRDEIVVFDRPNININRIPFGIAPLLNVPPHIWSTLLRRHTFFLLIWLEAGTGWHYIDFERDAIEPNTLFLISPNQVQYWDVEMPPPTGWHLSFEREFFLLNGMEDFFSKLTLFDSLHPVSAIQFEAEQAVGITGRFEQMFAENQARDDGWVESIGAYLQLLLVQAQRQKAKIQPPQPRTAVTMLARRFVMLLRRDVSAEYTVEGYARRLGVTGGYLTEMVKRAMGVPAGTLIRQQLALEAKRWLAHTDQTAAQIARQLGFKDASYFGRFFKREVGVSPGVFRRQFNKRKL